ncbi:MAG: Calx-beta domain-containing protein [Planktothrix sp.]
MLNLTPPRITLTIDGRDWSAFPITLEVGYSEFSIQQGIAYVQGRIEISLGRAGVYPTSPDPIENSSAWDRGTKVTISTSTLGFLPSAGENLYIIKSPDRPYGREPKLSFEVGCELTLRNYPQPNPKDRFSGINYSPVSRNQVITNILLSAGINASNLSISGLSDSLEFPLDPPPEGKVAYAGQIAAADLGILYVQADGVVRVLKLNPNLSPSGGALNLEPVDFAPVSGFAFIPVEKFTTESIIYDIQPLSTYSFVTESINTPFNLFGVGSDSSEIVWQRETTTFSFTQNSDTTTTVTDTILGVIAPSDFPNSTSIRTSSISTVIRKWNTDFSLASIETTTQVPKFIFNFPKFDLDFSLIVQQVNITTYGYDLDQIIASVITKTDQPESTIFNILSSSDFARRTSSLITTTYKKIIEADQWEKVTTPSQPRGIVNPEKYPFSFTLIQSGNSTRTKDNNPPPATTFQPPLYKISKEAIKSIITTSQPINDPNPREPNPIFVPHISSKPQLDRFTQASINYQRALSKGWFVEVPLTNILFGRYVTISDEFGSSYTMLCNAITYSISPKEATTKFTGITISSTIVPPGGGGGVVYTLPPTTTIDTDKPTITIAFDPPGPLSEADPITTYNLIITANKALPSNGSVQIRTINAASNFVQAIPPIVNFLAGETQKIIPLNVLNDLIPEDTATATFTIIAVSNNLKIGSPSTVNVGIFDNDPPIINIVVTPATINEGSAATFTVTRTAPILVPLTVFYTIGGSANQTDYVQVLSGQVDFNINQTSINIPITTIFDFESTAPETLILTINPSPNYAIDPGNATAILTIVDVIPELVSTEILITGEATYKTSELISTEILITGDATYRTPELVTTEILITGDASVNYAFADVNLTTEGGGVVIIPFRPFVEFDLQVDTGTFLNILPAVEFDLQIDATQPPIPPVEFFVEFDLSIETIEPDYTIVSDAISGVSEYQRIVSIDGTIEGISIYVQTIEGIIEGISDTINAINGEILGTSNFTNGIGNYGFIQGISEYIVIPAEEIDGSIQGISEYIVIPAIIVNGIINGVSDS